MSMFYIYDIHRHNIIHRLLIGPAYVPCFGTVVMSSATT